MRDRFICGLSDGSTRKALLSEEKVLTLDQAFQKALAREQAWTNSKIMKSDSSATDTVHTMYHAKWKQPHTSGGSNSRGGSSNGGTGYPSKKKLGTGKGSRNYSPKTPCVRCKLTRCKPGNCTTKCFMCNNVGHTKQNCFKNPNRINVHEMEESNGDSMYYIDVNFNNSNISNDGKGKPLIDVVINSRPVKLELDTGSPISCIGGDKLSSCNIRQSSLVPSSRVIRVANGNLVENVQECSVVLGYGNCVFSGVPLHVVDGRFPSLLGRDWIRCIWGDNWMEKLVSSQVNVLRLNTTVPEFVDQVKRSSVFQEGLGTVTGYEATLELKEGAEAVYRKARTVPYCSREGLKQEIDRLDREGVLEKVDYSDMASPIVMIDKPDGSIRICGDYKSTLNPQLATKQIQIQIKT